MRTLVETSSHVLRMMHHPSRRCVLFNGNTNENTWYLYTFHFNKHAKHRTAANVDKTGARRFKLTEFNNIIGKY